MIRILIIGAGRGIGLETARQALEAGHCLRALARSDAGMALSRRHLEAVRGDALRMRDLQAALIGVDVVIQSLGVKLEELLQPIRLFSMATQVMIAAMKAQDVNRLICVTGFGAGDSSARMGVPQRIRFQIVFGRAYVGQTPALVN